MAIKFVYLKISAKCMRFLYLLPNLMRSSNDLSLEKKLRQKHFFLIHLWTNIIIFVKLKVLNYIFSIDRFTFEMHSHRDTVSNFSQTLWFGKSQKWKNLRSDFMDTINRADRVFDLWRMPFPTSSLRDSRVLVLTLINCSNLICF